MISIGSKRAIIHAKPVPNNNVVYGIVAKNRDILAKFIDYVKFVDR